MCGLFPCTKTRVETKEDRVIKTVIAHVNKATCCPGYVETVERQCAPVCLASCANGAKCVAPNECKCQPEPSFSAPGFAGPTCKRFVCLQADTWGSKCDRICPEACSENSYCSASSGKCLCYPGWRGPKCTIACKFNDLSDECQEANSLPPIMEPEVNLLDSMPRSQQRAEALMLDNSEPDDIQIISKSSDSQSWSSPVLACLIGGLSCLVLILLVAILSLMRRYRSISNELYYNSVSGASDRSDSNYSSSGSANSHYYSASPPGKNLEKNLSFAAATRNILAGVTGGAGVGQEAGKEAAGRMRNMEKRALPLVPRVESNLIRSQQASEQNIYSEPISASKNDSANSNTLSRVPKLTVPVKQISEDEEHIYQVPKLVEGNARLPSEKEHLDASDVSISMAEEQDYDIIPQQPAKK